MQNIHNQYNTKHLRILHIQCYKLLQLRKQKMTLVSSDGLSFPGLGWIFKIATKQTYRHHHMACYVIYHSKSYFRLSLYIPTTYPRSGKLFKYFMPTQHAFSANIKGWHLVSDDGAYSLYLQIITALKQRPYNSFNIQSELSKISKNLALS